jgi:hypothetical protein
MLVSATNFALRRASDRDWRSEAEKIEGAIKAMPQVELISLSPGIARFRLQDASPREGTRLLLQLGKLLPHWRLSEESAFELPETFSYRKIS